MESEEGSQEICTKMNRFVNFENMTGGPTKVFEEKILAFILKYSLFEE